MAGKALVGIVTSELVAAQIFEDLQDAGFTNGDISILIPEGRHMALGDTAANATAGGLTGALVGLGISEYEAQQYEARLSDGNLLISLHTDSDDQRTTAREILERHGARSVATAGESSPPKHR